MSVYFVAHPDYSYPFAATHPFPMDKFAVLQELLHRDGTLAAGTLLRPTPIADDLLHRVHTPRWIEAIRHGTWSRDEGRRVGLPWSPELARRTFLAVGGTWLTVQLAWQHGRAGHLAGGTHHAFADAGAGYCLCNDLAVAARAFLSENPNKRLAIVDCDVHQGDGTALLLQDEARAFTCSLHSEKNFPLRKQQSDLDVAVPDGCDDDQYLSMLEQTLATVLERSKPDLVIYDAGVDVHVADRLGKLALTDAGLLARERMVLGWASRHGLPLAAVIGGGYDRDLQALAGRHAIVHQQLLTAP